MNDVENEESETVEILYSYNDIHLMIRDGCVSIKEEYDPETILAIGGGGLVPARIIRTYLKIPIICVTVQVYDSLDGDGKINNLQWFGREEERKSIKGKRVLIVDDVKDTGHTLKICTKRLLESSPSAVGIFVLNHKFEEGETFHDIFGDVTNNIFAYQACKAIKKNTWLIYPWEVDDIRSHQEKSENTLSGALEKSIVVSEKHDQYRKCRT